MRKHLVLIAAIASMAASIVAAQQTQGLATAERVWPLWQVTNTRAAQDGQPGLPVTVRFDLLEEAAAAGGVIELPLDRDLTVRATIRWAQSSGSQTFIAGPLLDTIEGEASLTIVENTLVGRIVANGRLFMVRRAADSPLHIVTEIDQTSLPPEAAPLIPETLSGDTFTSMPPGAEADTNQFVDLLILYTSEARAAAGGTAAIVAELIGAVNNANLALANAGVTHRYRLTHYEEVAYPHVDSNTDLARLQGKNDGFLDGVHALRDQYRADVVTMLGTSTDACGIGYLMGPGSTASFEAYAFNVVLWSCANANLSMAHEIGHNMGLHHDRLNALSGTPAYPYAYGYAIPGVARDVMAYECAAGCPRLAIYSTPLFNFPGTAMRAGTSTEDGARALNNTSSIVANFRQTVSPSLPPTVTTGLASGIGVTSATLNGTANPNGTTATGWLEYGSTTSYGNTTPVQTLGSGNGAVAIGGGGISGLVCNTPYHVRARATNAGGSSDGGDKTFTTAACPLPPSVVTGVATGIFTRGATLNGTANPNALSTTATFQYGLTTSYGSTTLPVNLGAGSAPVAIGNAAIVGLACNTLYHFRAVTTNAVGTTTGSDATFTTLSSLCTASSGDFNGDFDGDGKADLGLYRPSAEGYWYVKQTSTNYATYLAYQWGMSTDIAVPGDYDGDGHGDLGLYRESTGYWYVLLSNGTYTTYLARQWGASGDIPVPGDYDGDGKTDLGVYRPSTGYWYILLSSTNYTTYIAKQWGISSDVPVVGDYDGDGKADLGLYRESTGYWYVLLSNGTYTTYLAQQWGASGDILVPGDYDGDGKTDLGVYRPSTGYWYVGLSRNNYSTYLTLQWGLSTDLPVAADYDGDGKADLGVYRPGTGYWYVLKSSTNFTTYIAEQWGISSDVPVLRRQ